MSTPPTQSSAAEIARRVERHSFSPVDNGFTVDPETGYDGDADLESSDWSVRTLAIRDLVRRGQEDVSPVVELLSHDDETVRQVATMTLGLLRAETAVDALRRRLVHDPVPVVRSHAAISLGQVGAPKEAVATPLETEDHTDVRHQGSIAMDRIEKGVPIEPEVAEQFAALDDDSFGHAKEGDAAPGFTLEDTEGRTWSLSEATGGKTVVLLWIFADWCPVCHKEFHQLINRRERFRELDIAVATLECHDQYRCRVMEGKEFQPSYWFSDKLPGTHPHDPYPEEIWWPHLVDRAASVGVQYGIDPWQFAVHSEVVNRPTTVIIDPDGMVRLAHFGTYWGDRPSIDQMLSMIETGTFDFKAPAPRKGPH